VKRTVLAACFGWLFSAVDIVLLLLFQHSIAVSFGTDVKNIGAVIAAGSLGSAVGGIAFAQLGDRYGRVRALGWSIILYSLATAGMALSPGVAVLALMRFISGIGTGGEWSLGFALIAEVSPRTGRGRLGGLVAAMFNVGTFLAILLFQANLGWRVAFGAMALPALGVLVLRLTVPESPVWLALQEARRKGEVDPALEANFQRPPIALLFRGRLLGPTLKTTLIFTLMNFAFFGFSTTFMRYLQEPAAAGALGLERAAQAPFQFTLNLASLISAIVAGAASDRIGRRLSFSLFCLLGCSGSLALFLVTRGASGGVPAGLLPIFAAITCGYGIIGVIGTITSEIFPTHLRATGPGFCQNIGKGLGGAAGPILAGVLVARFAYPFALSISGVVLLLLAALIWTLPAVDGREVRAVEDEGYLAARGAILKS
jgi:MFS family permease